MGNELFYVDQDGKKQDSELWDELLGDDTLPSDLPSAEDGAATAESEADQEAIVDMAMRLFECADRQHTGLLVSLWLDPETAAKIAVEGGENPDTLHVTLSYCGDVADLGEAGVLEAVNIVKGIAAGVPGPVVGRVGGVGRFLPSPQSDGKAPVYAVADVPGLSHLQAAIAEALTKAGIVPRGEHGWSPHITLKYAEPDDLTIPIVEEQPLLFDSVTISAGDEQFHVPFGGMPIELSETPKPKRRKRPTYWEGMKLSRQPSVFEASVLSLSDVPDYFTVMNADAIEALGNIRRADLSSVNLSEPAPLSAGMVEQVRHLQHRAARYGAFEVERELARQGIENLSIDPPEAESRAAIDEAVNSSAHLSESAVELALKLSSDWQSSLKQLSLRVRRARRRPESESKTLLTQLALSRVNDGLSQAVGRTAQQAFAFGRQLRMSEYVRAKRTYRDRLKQLASDAVDPDLIDYVVQTAIHDTNLCEKCEEMDGQVFEFGSDAQESAEPPYYLCEGGERCRCMQVMVVGDWRDKAAVRDAVGTDRLVPATENQAERLIKQRQRLQSGDEDE